MQSISHYTVSTISCPALLANVIVRCRSYLVAHFPDVPQAVRPESRDGWPADGLGRTKYPRSSDISAETRRSARRSEGVGTRTADLQQPREQSATDQIRSDYIAGKHKVLTLRRQTIRTDASRERTPDTSMSALCPSISQSAAELGGRAIKPCRIASHRIASYTLVPNNHIVLYRVIPGKQRMYFSFVTLSQRVTFYKWVMPWNIDEQANQYLVVVTGR